MEKEIEDALRVLEKEKISKGGVLKQVIKESLENLLDNEMGDRGVCAWILEKKIVKPFVLSLFELPLKSRGFGVSLSLIHKMVMWRVVDTCFIPEILSGFEKSILSSSEMRLRITQMVLPLVQDPFFVKGSNLLHLFRICITLVETSRNQTVNTSRVIVAHMVSGIFERPGLLEGADKEEAEKSCLEILRISLDKAKNGEILGFDMLSASISDGHLGVISSPLLMENLPEVYDFLLSQLVFDNFSVISRSLFLLMQIIKKILFSDEGSLIFLLLSICRTDMPCSMKILREEFLYSLPHGILTLGVLSSQELADSVFSVLGELNIEEVKEINYMYMDQFSRTEVPNDLSHICTLTFYKFYGYTMYIYKKLEETEDLDQIVQIFVAYLSNMLDKIVGIDALSEEDKRIESLKNILENAGKALHRKYPRELNQILLSFCKLAVKNRKAFYALLMRVSIENKEDVVIWKELLFITIQVEKIDEKEAWAHLLGKIEEFPDEVLKKVLNGLCDVNGTEKEKISDFFLQLISRSKNLQNEFLMVLGKIFPEEEIRETPAYFIPLLSAFFNRYFLLKCSEETHSFVLRYFHGLTEKLYGSSEFEEVLREVLSSLSLGIRTSGETFHESWREIYGILILAMEIPSFSSIIFDILQVITSRLLAFIPLDSLKVTVKMLSICCLGRREQNMAFQGLQCIREVVEHIVVSEVEEETKNRVWNACICLLCSLAYDARDDIRDSSILLIFELIYFSNEKNCINWNSLIKVFLKKILCASIYVKDKEIYTGEHDEEISEEECACMELGACNVQMYQEEEDMPVNAKRAEDSAKGMLLSVSSLMFEHFEEIKRFPSFPSLWNLLQTVVLRFSSDPGLESTVITVIRIGTSKIKDPISWNSFFHLLANLSKKESLVESYPESLIQLLKRSYENLTEDNKKTESVQFLEAVTHILKKNQVPRKNIFSFVEYESISSLIDFKDSISIELSIETLLAWMNLFFEHKTCFSTSFILSSISYLSELLISNNLSETVYLNALSLLVFFQERSVQYSWQIKARDTLKRILLIQVERKMELKLVPISRRILGIDLENNHKSNGIIEKILREEKEFSEELRKAEQEMLEYLVFLEDLAKKIEKPDLLALYRLLEEFQRNAESNLLFSAYLKTTQILCSLITEKQELLLYGEKWILSSLSEYNKEIRRERTRYSHYKRESISYILHNILNSHINIFLHAPIVKHQIFLCASSLDKNISLQALQLLNQISNEYLAPDKLLQNAH
ncbi:hypothetical protein NEFER03_1223 [Nematocida sp. LUAm3]|nr:hypothetical protein NEFER03_1223 [Nematocida sp. LUAm3]KAI5175832.1 hypothetical protein NEFER02_1701 [Nematocida sp. LUAm2]KAI5178328.1 hypothetical protein NEFER01_1495 [Nematocida sp. LUAm1]